VLKINYLPSKPEGKRLQSGPLNGSFPQCSSIAQRLSISHCISTIYTYFSQSIL